MSSEAPVTQPVKIASHTEKKEKRAGKGGKGHVKVIKRNLIQSSELVSRELPSTQGGQIGANNADGVSPGLVASSGPAKRSSNARGSSSKGGAGAKGNGGRQHKF